MTEAVRAIIESFERLSEGERTEVLRRVSQWGGGDLDEETLAQVADETFLMYDADEAGRARD